MTKVYVVGGAYGYGKLFQEHGWEITIEIEEANLVCFTGGEDVSPHIYGEKKHLRTYSNPVRDAFERGIFNLCMTNEVPMVGICRGGQFLNCLSGGRMFQHVSNHTVDHYLTDLESEDKILVSSTHHQMMRAGTGGEVVAVANNGGYKESFEGGTVHRVEEEDDTEVVFYPLTKALCFQPHPEFDSPEYVLMKKYFFKLINKYLGVN